MKMPRITLIKLSVSIVMLKELIMDSETSILYKRKTDRL